MIYCFNLRMIPALAALLFFAACSNEPNQNRPVTTTTEAGTSKAPPATEVKERGNALVRVINAMTGEQPIDIFADDAKVFTSISYKTVSPYKEVSTDGHTFRIRPAGEDAAQPLAENSDGLNNGKHYTLVAVINTKGRPTLYMYTDDLVPPAPGKVEARVVHASADAGEIDVYKKDGDKKLLGLVAGLTATPYHELDPMKGTLEVRPTANNNTVLTIPNASFDAGNTYTIVLTGKAKGAPKLEATIIEDKLESPSPRPTNANKR